MILTPVKACGIAARHWGSPAQSLCAVLAIKGGVDSGNAAEALTLIDGAFGA